MIDSWTSVVQLALVAACLVGSSLVWDGIWRRWSRGLSVLEPQGDAAAPIPFNVVLGVIGWLTFQFLVRLSAEQTHPATPSLSGVQLMCGINLLIAVLLPVILTDGLRQTAAGVGLSGQRIIHQMWLGLQAFLAAVWPTTLLLALSSFWRNEETQHSYLQALREHADAQWIAWIVLSAVVAAPLAEELIFRVVLQGWLSERCSGPTALGITAAVFALVHGWHDALPLVPLSLILGYVFHQTRRYWTCVTTHALFNAANLALVLLAD
jgi:membrane protease YdiL (CAAX protease family)